jgi:hypothetical protein
VSERNTSGGEYKTLTKGDFKYKGGFELKDDPKMQSISIRNWHSAELPTMAERKMSSDDLNKEPESSTLPSFTNEHDNFHRSASQSSSLSAPASTEE